MSRRIYLASASLRRSALLASLGLDFSVLTVPVDETPPPLEPEKAVEIVAARKVQAAAETLREKALVIGADTIVVHRGQILGKPSDPGHARQMLRLLQGECHTVYTGVAVAALPEGETVVAHEATRVCFAPMTEAEVEAYVATGEPLDKAGAYAAQGLGAVFIRRIEGCYFNVIGLPLNLLSKMLKGFGFNLLLRDEG
ncbi:MAG: Maf family protein [Bacillota bacterium]